MLTFDLVTSRISQRHSLYQVWTPWGHSFLSYAPDINVKNTLIDHVTLTFDLQNSTTSRASQGHSLDQVWTLWDHSFWSYAADKQTNRQTDRQTDGLEYATHADWHMVVGVRNKKN